MKLHLTQAAGNQLITGYGEGWVEVNHIRYTENMIVMPEAVKADWAIGSFDDLSEAAFVQLAELKPEVVLLGTGKTHRFIHPKLSRALTESGIGIECMDTAAACRTYNILMAEGRNVAAALLL
ncbi:MAG: Mth938-like domain-containing protein [Methylophilaceae bacterium]